jgi:hypothetical protein
MPPGTGEGLYSQEDLRNPSVMAQRLQANSDVERLVHKRYVSRGRLDSGLRSGANVPGNGLRDFHVSFPVPSDIHLPAIMLPRFEEGPDSSYVSSFARSPNKRFVIDGFYRCYRLGHENLGSILRVAPPVQPTHVEHAIGRKRLLFRLVLNLDDRTYMRISRSLGRDPCYGWQGALVADQQNGAPRRQAARAWPQQGGHVSGLRVARKVCTRSRYAEERDAARNRSTARPDPDRRRGWYRPEPEACPRLPATRCGRLPASLARPAVCPSAAPAGGHACRHPQKALHRRRKISRDAYAA